MYPIMYVLLVSSILSYLFLLLVYYYGAPLFIYIVQCYIINLKHRSGTQMHVIQIVGQKIEL